MSVREYIGARYVPVFADPIEWDGTLSYEPLTVVKYQGASYVSRQWVPEGIALSNADYWVLWADYNAQLEAYRREVQTFDGRITTNAEGVADLADEIAAIKAANWVTSVRIADNAVTTGKIADNAVTTGKIADEAVTGSKIADGSIDSGHLAEDSVTANAIANGSVGTGEIQDLAVTNGKLANNAVSYAKLDVNLKARITDSSHYLVAIGDSFGDANAGGIAPLPTKWPAMVANGLNMRLFNGCKSGCGFIYSEGSVVTGYTDNSFINQIKWAADNVDADLVDYVVIYGGINDWTRRSTYASTLEQQISTLATAIIECIRQAHNSFPSAHIVCIPMNVGYCDQTRFNGFLTFAANVINGVLASTVNLRATSVIRDGFTWLIPHGAATAFQTDLLHPNQTGQNIISNLIYAVLTGGYSGAVKVVDSGYQRPIENGTVTISQIFANSCMMFGIRVLSDITYAASGNHDIATTPSVSFSGSSGIGLIVELGKGDGWSVVYLSYSGIIRIITTRANVTIPQYSYMSGVCPVN